MKTTISAQRKIPSLDEIIFENRNQEYGAFELRENYYKYLILSFLIIVFILVGVVIIDYLSDNHNGPKPEISHKVTINIDPTPPMVQPPPPPPPPSLNSIAGILNCQIPKIVDTIASNSPELMGINDLDIINHNEFFDTTHKVYRILTMPESDLPEPAYTEVSEPATFQGKNINSFGKWVLENLRCTDEINAMEHDGRLEIHFIVNKSGSIEDVQITGSVNSRIDGEVVRVIKTSPKWKPGKLNGYVVRQRFVMPIVFRLQNI